MTKRIIAAGVSAVAALSFAALTTPAQADVDGVVSPATTPPTARTETVTVEDGGGVDHKISIRWNKKYRDAAGAMRVSVSDLKVERLPGQAPADDDGVDVHFDVQQGESRKIIQHKVYDGLDLGADLSVTFNPRNPRSDIGDTRIRIKVGTDDDGLPNSRWVYLYQLGGIPAPATP